MEPGPFPFLNSWHFKHSAWFYTGLVIFADLLVRTISALLKTVETTHKTGDPTWPEFKKCFLGCGSENPENDDYWYPFIIGLFELSAYPILMATEKWTFIGAWLGFKTVAQWKSWGEKRHAFNRFLIGNLLVLFLSVSLMNLFISVSGHNGSVPSASERAISNVISSSSVTCK